MVNPVHGLDRLQRRKANQDCRHLKVNLRANKATAVTWARCMGSKGLSMVLAQGAWVLIISTEDKTIRLVATEATGPGMAPARTGTAIAVDGAATMVIESLHPPIPSMHVLWQPAMFPFDFIMLSSHAKEMPGSSRHVC